nr:hypothetical protein [Mycobacterium sp. MS1601]
MGIGDGHADLGEIHPGQQPQAARVGRGNGVTQQVPTGAAIQERVARLEGQVSRIEGHDAAAVDQPGVGTEGRHHVGHRLDVHGGVNLTQVGLEHLERGRPPILLREV